MWNGDNVNVGWCTRTVLYLVFHISYLVSRMSRISYLTSSSERPTKAARHLQAATPSTH